jgi:hypothetical protein
LLYGRDSRLGNLDDFNGGYQPSKFIENLHESWVQAKANILRAAEINKKHYDKKYDKEPPVFKEGEYVRLRQFPTKIELKKKLRNDHYSDLVQITKVISNQNVEIKLKNKSKVVNVKARATRATSDAAANTTNRRSSCDSNHNTSDTSNRRARSTVCRHVGSAAHLGRVEAATTCFGAARA